jgi:hypothetical protein
VAVRAPPKREEVINSDPANNVTDYIYEKMGVNLHQQPGHPICTIKDAIYAVGGLCGLRGRGIRLMVHFWTRARQVATACS